ncbi:hypothetical protein V5799_021990 [Amblyomma americanum]|uniref:Uncharacterized protein n=1 Tax=Amblyomma americanum TaxID=6943 RepID=A0AAQ4FND9_AMBAM
MSSQESAAKARRKRRKTGPDSRFSWVVALACGGVNVFMHASGKVVGLLFFGMLEEFSVSRETAAWPLVLNNTLLNLAACLSGTGYWEKAACKHSGRGVLLDDRCMGIAEESCSTQRGEEAFLHGWSTSSQPPSAM